MARSIPVGADDLSVDGSSGDVAGAGWPSVRGEPGFVQSFHFVDALVENGVTSACICPGSRSTPMTLALAAHPAVTIWRHVDERSAGFFALGMAKARRGPVALVCTSGTAAANFFPAIVEAFYSRTPLIVMTADRPPELRDTGALQTINQLELYGVHVKWFVDMPVPGRGWDDGLTASVRECARRVVAESVTAPAGPVHVNLPFSEPLILANQSVPTRVEASSRGAWRGADVIPDPSTISPIALSLREIERGIIVVGPQDDPSFGRAVMDLSERTGYPVLADALSQLRCGNRQAGYVVTNYDVFLRDPEIRHRLRPEMVLRFGGSPVSKSLLEFLTEAGCRQIGIDEAGKPWDPQHVLTETVTSTPALFAGICSQALSASMPVETWARDWMEVSRRSRLGSDFVLTSSDTMPEPAVFLELASLIPEEVAMFVGNSMPIRDLDAVFPLRVRPLRILGNRGVNGIDGLVSTALGVAAETGQRVVLVLGDLSLYHDLNGLLAARLQSLDATIVLVNNDGGGIFHFLPQVDLAASFEDLFATPTGLNYLALAAAYGCHVEDATDTEHFRDAVRQSFARKGISLIQLKSDRGANVAMHRSMWQQAVAAQASGD